MLRVLLLSVVVFLTTVFPAAAQQPVVPAQPPAAAPATPEGSALNILAAALDARSGFQEISATHWRLRDRVDIPIQAGVRIFADEVDLYLDTNLLVASGNVAFTNPEGRISAEKIEFNFGDGTAKFYQAAGIVSLGLTADRAQFGNQEPDVYFYGDQIDKLGPKKYRITRGGFSTCVQPTPRWEITSNSITLNLDEYALTRGTVLRVKGVPLLYLPALYYPLQEDQRSTGFLMPRYGTSTVRGGSLSNAFFWAIGRSQDATFFHDWFARAGQGQGAEYRYVSGVQSSGIVRFYRFNQRETLLEGSTTPLRAKTSYQLNASVNQDLWRLKSQGSVEYFTDVETQQLYQQNAFQRTQSKRTVAAGVNGTFGVATLASYFQRSEVFSDARNSVLYGSLPRATAIITPTRLFGLPMYGGMNSEYAFIPSQTLLDGKVTRDSSLGRMDLAPTLRVPLSRLTFLSVNTSAAYRQNYQWTHVDATTQQLQRGLIRQDFSLQTDIVGPVAAKIWDTPGSTFSERMKHVVEPTFSVAYVTQIDPQKAATTVTPLTGNNAAMRLTYGLTNRLFARAASVGDTRGGTREFLTVSAQQTFYSDPASSRNDTTYISASGRPAPVDLSPIALVTRFSPRDGFDANGRVEYDVTGNGFQVVTMGGTFSSTAGATAGSSANFSFSRQRFTPSAPVSSYLSASTSMRLMQGRTSTFYSLNWDLDAGYIYSQGLGATYLAQCCGIQADFQVVNLPPALRSTVVRDRRFNFAFVLAGLGTFSNFFGLFGGQQ
jgi:LPS-assembly protein